MIEKDTSQYPNEDLFSNNEDNKNKFDSEYGHKDNPNENRTQSVYIINLTPIRMGIVLAVIVFAIILMFSIGFQTGLKKISKSEQDKTQNADILFRDNIEKNTMRSSSSIEEKRSNTIVDISSVRETNPSSRNEMNMTITGSSTDGMPSTLTKDFEDLDNTLGSRKQVTSTSDMQVSKSSAANIDSGAYIPQMEEATTIVNTPRKIEQTSSQSTSQTDSNLVYFIQVAFVANKEGAEADRDFLKKHFPRAFIKEDVAKDNSKIYKIKIGRYESKADIEKALSALKNISPRYSDSYIYTDKK